MSAVTWKPEYKLLAGKSNEDVQVDYLANLQQNSGEEWNQVKLTLSTAQPMLNATPPELAMLQPVLVNRGTPAAGPFLPPPARPAKGMKGTRSFVRRPAGTIGATMPASKRLLIRQLNDAAAQEQNADLMRSRDEVLAEAKRKAPVPALQADGPSITYHLSNKLSVPSHRDEQVVEIVKLKLTPKYYYKAVP